LNRYCTAP